MPSGVEDRLRVMPKIDEAVHSYGISPKDVYLDCMIFPLSVDSANGPIYLETLKRVKAEYPEYKSICGLNNISYGLPEGDVLNSSFLSMCAALGQEASYLEITKASGAMVRAIKGLLNRDEYLSDYLASYRAGLLDVWKEEEEAQI